MDSTEVSKYSIMSQLGPDTSFALRKSIDDILANGESHSGVARSPSLVKDHNLNIQLARNMSDSVPEVKGEPQSKQHWVRNGYPRTGPKQHAERIVLNNREVQQNQTAIASEYPGIGPATQEAQHLRRSPALDKLRERISHGEGLQMPHTKPATGIEAGPASVADTNAIVSADRDASTNTKAWHRGIYPLQVQHEQLTPEALRDGTRVSSAAGRSDDQNHIATATDSLPKVGDPNRRNPSAISTGLDQPGITQVPTANVQDPSSQVRAQNMESTLLDPRFSANSYPLQHHERLNVSQSTLFGSTIESPQAQILESTPTSRSFPGARKSRTYPLQSPASIIALRKPPTPPSSSEDEDTVPKNYTSRPSNADGRHGAKFAGLRGVYPMQHAPSVADMREGAHRTHFPDHPEYVPPDHATNSRSADTLRNAKRSAGSRHLYPIQHLPSIADLQDMPVHSTKRDGRSNDRPAQKTQSAASSNSQRRTAYPIQHLPSSMDLRKASDYTTVTESQLASVTTSDPSDQDVQNTVQCIAKDLPNVNLVPPTPSSEQDDYEKKMHNRSLASRTLRQWRRQMYPLEGAEGQTLMPEDDQQHSKAHTPRTRSPSPGPTHLPKNVRAVTEASECQRDSRTIIVCLDGTGDKFDNDNSNIIQLVSSMKKDDPRQVTYYQAGIGTYNKGGLNTGFSAAMDMAVGSELGLHVRDAYQFLMHSYKEGDKICIFGFSRGAYTARCLAGMVHKVGLLPPRNLQQIAFAYEFYSDTSPDGWTQSRLFKATFSIDVSVYFLGCFDSVASVGIIPRQLPLSSTATNKCRYFRHAMALDERRAKFKVCRFEAKDLDEDELEDEAGTKNKKHQDREELCQPYRPDHLPYGPLYHPNVTDDEYERLAEPEAAVETDVSEVWFAGAHADVGGGAVANTTRHKLAQIPLRWMIRQAFECNTGIMFKTKKLAEFGLDVHTLWPRYRRLDLPTLHGPPPSFLEKYDPHTTGLPPRSVRRGKLVLTEKWDETTSSCTSAAKAAATATGDALAFSPREQLYHLKSHKDEDWTPEQVEDFYDSLAPLNDQLVDAPNWWLLEAWPVQYKVPVGNGKVELRTGPNLGRYRGVGDREPLMHWTVKQRERVLGYRVQARTAPFTRWKLTV